MSLSNSYSTNNLSIPNSIILNNYSIQNLIISPNNIDSNYEFQINSYQNIPQNQYAITYSPSPKKNPIKSYNSMFLEPINLYEPIPIMSSIGSYQKIDKSKINRYNKISLNKNSLKLIPVSNPENNNKKSKENKTESHPQDSTSRSKNKIKNSISQKILKVSNNLLSNINSKNVVSFPKNNLSRHKKKPLNTKIIYIEPKNLVNLKEFMFEEEVGKGTFGKIFSVKWKKNNRYYAMKKEILNDFEDVQKRKTNCKIIQNFIKNSGHKGVINLYGNLCFKKKNKNTNTTNNNDNNEEKNDKVKNFEYIYYELMEKAERDWDKEINIRSQYELYYTEKELLNIIYQLITTLSLLQKYHITHRDIKPQNILVSNGNYKLCDFGEIRVLKRDGLIVQRVRGSELYMSPILFYGLHNNLIQVKHNTYKSDVFSLGMCLFYAASLTYGGVDSIRELSDMNEIKKIIFNYLGKRYSQNLILLILAMIEVDENKRPNFIELEKQLSNFIK